MSKWIFEELKKGEWKQVGKPMGKRSAIVARAILKRTSSETRRKNRIRKT